jgi:hypothetical protein
VGDGDALGTSDGRAFFVGDGAADVGKGAGVPWITRDGRTDAVGKGTTGKLATA